jgi:hypothetical protein
LKKQPFFTLEQDKSKSAKIDTAGLTVYFELFYIAYFYQYLTYKFKDRHHQLKSKEISFDVDPTVVKTYKYKSLYGSMGFSLFHGVRRHYPYRISRGQYTCKNEFNANSRRKHQYIRTKH